MLDQAGERITRFVGCLWRDIVQGRVKVRLFAERGLNPGPWHLLVYEIVGRLPDGTLTRASQMRFAPNSGYAFAVGDNTWHSADPVGTEVTTRDSILLTYFVDAGLLRFLRNRGKRVGNFVLNEVRHITGGVGGR